MIYLGFVLSNPFSRDRINNVWNRVVSVSRNKTIEVGLYKTSGIIGANLGVTNFKTDHAGFNFDIELLGIKFDFIFYDNRHADQR